MVYLWFLPAWCARELAWGKSKLWEEQILAKLTRVHESATTNQILHLVQHPDQHRQATAKRAKKNYDRLQAM